MEENQTEYEREMYFIVPKRESGISSDLTALRMVNDLHNSREIDNLFLNHDEEFRAVSAYCGENSKKKNTIR